MRTITAILAASLSLVATTLPAHWFEVSPAAPTSRTPVTITLTTEPIGACALEVDEVAVGLRTVNIRLVSLPLICPAIIQSRTVSVDLGLLPFGEYTLHADFENIKWDGRFVVRNPLERMNAVSTPGGSPVWLGYLGGAYCSAGCSVLFGGVPGIPTANKDGSLVAVAPAHAAGLYDVRVIASDGKTSADLLGAIYYFDPAQAPDGTVFEPILFPVLDSASGASGSRWVATASIDNATNRPIEMFNHIDPVACVVRPCTELRPPMTLYSFEGSGYPRGALLYVPHSEPRSMAFGLRIRETSRNDDPGMEIVPVRQSGFFRNGMTLLNVPVGDSVRTKLRIYALDPMPVDFPALSAVISRDPLVIWTPRIPLRMQRSGNPNEPLYAELDLQGIPELKGVDELTIHIEPMSNAPMWAFASVVHNASQRLMIVTPQQ